MEDDKIRPGIDGVSDEELEYFGKNSYKMYEIEIKLREEGNGINTACLIVAIMALTFLITYFALNLLQAFLLGPQSIGYNIGNITIFDLHIFRIKLEDLVYIFKGLIKLLTFITGIVSIVLGTKGLRLRLGRKKGSTGLLIGWIVTIFCMLSMLIKIMRVSLWVFF